MISLVINRVNLVHVGDWGIDNSIEKVCSESHDVVALELVWTNRIFGRRYHYHPLLKGKEEDCVLLLSYYLLGDSIVLF